MNAEPLRPVDIGVDIGGTKIDVVAFAGSEVLARAIVPTPKDSSVLEITAQTVRALVRDLGRELSDLRAVGAGLPCVVDAPSGVITSGVNIEFGTRRVAEALTGLLGAPVSIANDVNAAAVGYAVRFGHTGSTAFLNLGTGVAAGVAVGGEAILGDSNIAGEIGHLQIDPGGPACACGSRGCIESFSGGAAIAQRWPTSEGAHAVGELLAAAQRGDETAQEIREGFLRGLLAALQAITLMTDPEKIVVGGGIAKSWDVIGPQLKERIERLEAGSAFAESVALYDRLVCVAGDPFPFATFGAARLARLQHRVLIPS